MKNYFLVLLILLGPDIAGAQIKDSVIKHYTLTRELTTASDKTTEGKFYNYLPIRMAAGDMAYIIYESKDYVVALSARDSVGHSGLKEDNALFVKAIGSKVAMPFRAVAEGPYYFFFTTSEKEATGKYTINFYYYTSANNKVTDSSSFCDKLLYIAGNTYLGFAFLKKSKKEGVVLETYEPSVTLLPDATCEIQHNVDDSYVCNYPVSKRLAATNKKFDELEKQISACGGGYEKKVYTAAMSNELERKDFVRRVDFILPGTLPYDIHSTHGPEKIKSRLSLRITGGGKDGFRLRLTIE